MKCAGAFCVVLIAGSLSPAARADVIVEPTFGTAEYVRMHLRDPGTLNSRSRQRDFSGPGWTAASSSGSGSGPTHYRSALASMDIEYFSAREGVQDGVSALGVAGSRVWHEGDVEGFTSAMASTETALHWRVDTPVLFHLTGLLEITGTLLSGDVSGAADAGIILRRGFFEQSERLVGLTDASVAIDWTIELEPGTYTLEGWASSFAFCDALDGEARSTVTYAFQGSFSAIPAPSAVLPLLGLACLRRRR